MMWGMCVSMRASVRVCGRADAGMRVNSGGQFDQLCNLIDGAGTSTMQRIVELSLPAAMGVPTIFNKVQDVCAYLYIISLYERR